MGKVGEDLPLGKRIYETNEPQPLISSTTSLLTLSLYCCWPQVCLLLIVLSFFNQWALLISIFLLSTLAMPAKPLLWKPFVQSYAFKTWRHYFSFSFLFEERLDHGKNYVFAEFPHGVFPMGPLLAGTLCNVLFPGFNIYSISASALFYIPGWRHFIGWMGSLPATSSNFKKLLKRGSVAVIVGGIAEMFMGHPKEERIMLLTRKGFVRVAVEEGADIVPVFHFGNSLILEFWPRALANISRKMRTSIGIQKGRWGTPLPQSRPIFMVTGHACKVNKTDPKKDPAAFEAEVNRAHAAVVEELKGLYDRHKGTYGWQDRPLVIQ